MTRLTIAAGTPVADSQTSRTAGPRGPVLMQDFHLMEKLARFNRERIPLRAVHAKGAGVFRVTRDVTAHTKAAFLSSVGQETEVFLRFSTGAARRARPTQFRKSVGVEQEPQSSGRHRAMSPIRDGSKSKPASS